jgi:hypothetical protein
MDESILEEEASWSEGEMGPLLALIPIDEVAEHRSR